MEPKKATKFCPKSVPNRPQFCPESPPDLPWYSTNPLTQFEEFLKEPVSWFPMKKPARKTAG
jgi:hypothetical protein